MEDNKIYFTDGTNLFCYDKKLNTLWACLANAFRGRNDAMKAKVSCNTHAIGTNKHDAPLFVSERQMLEGKEFIDGDAFARQYNNQKLAMCYFDRKEVTNG